MTNPVNNAEKPRNKGGRPKGSPNRATADVRAAITTLLETTAPKLQGWLDRVAKKDPKHALELVVKLAEYHIPKLSRAEVTGAGGAPFEVRVVDPTRVARHTA